MANSFFVFVVTVVALVESRRGPCFLFGEDLGSYMSFDDTAPMASSAHYRLQFRTVQTDALIFYAGDPIAEPYDYEALFIRGGKLHYFLFNPTETGTGGTFGIHFQTNLTVSTGTWVKVEFFRNKKVSKRVNGKDVESFQSGLNVAYVTHSDGHEPESHVDDITREGINIQGDIWLGWTQHDLNTSLERFEGRIKNFQELITGRIFDRHNFNSEVKRSCGAS